MCQARMPLHSPSSGAWAKVQPQGTRHLQTSNQSPLSRQLGTSAIASSSSWIRPGSFHAPKGRSSVREGYGRSPRNGSAISSSASHSLGGEMAWRLEGSYFETCSCDVVCPCTASMSLGATKDRCNVVLVFRIKNGEVDGTDVSGLTVAAVADTPKVMTEGNWRLGVVIDSAASDEQAEKLGAVFSGALGGPMESLGPLVGENLGVERLPIEIQEDGIRHSVRIGDAVDFEIEDVVPFGVETGEPAKITGIFHPAGSELTVARATRSAIDAFGISYDAKAAFSRSQFSWAA